MLEAVDIQQPSNVRYNVDYGQALKLIKCTRGTPKMVSSRCLGAVNVSFLKDYVQGKGPRILTRRRRGLSLEDVNTKLFCLWSNQFDAIIDTIIDPRHLSMSLPTSRIYNQLLRH